MTGDLSALADRLARRHAEWTDAYPYQCKRVEVDPADLRAAVVHLHRHTEVVAEVADLRAEVARRTDPDLAARLSRSQNSYICRMPDGENSIIVRSKADELDECYTLMRAAARLIDGEAHDAKD